jgi:hypothetical protein
MIYFFKMKRWQSTRDHKFFKYSKYALGEIIIVIIGIVVAVIMHNWNEQRKKRNNFNKVLVEVEKELIMNINSVRGGLDFYNNRDSICQRILYDTLTINDFTVDRYGYNLMTVVFRTTAPTIKTDAFSKLMIDSEDISAEQDSVSKRLTFLYTDLKDGVFRYNDFMWELTAENLKTYQIYPWFKNLILYLPFEEAIPFYLNDSIHKNRVTNYALIGVYNHRRRLEEFDTEAIKSYELINKYLSRLNLTSSDSMLFNTDAESYNDYVGVYKVKNYQSPLHIRVDSVLITIENEELIQIVCFANNKSYREMVPGNGYFRNKQSTGFYRFIKEPNGSVLGYTWSNGVRRMEMYKVR